MGRWQAEWPERCHFIGVGGVAMSGLALVLKEHGVRVSGSDGAIYPPASLILEAAGIEVFTPFDPAHLGSRPDLVVVGNAISPGNSEVDAAVRGGLSIASMAEVIERLLVPSRRVSVVAGTHGKTTTTAMLAHLHQEAGNAPSFLIGGSPLGLSSGARLGSGRDLILEGDEYDTSYFDKGPKFLHYWPKIAVLGAVEFDHADIYRDIEDVMKTFSWLVRMIPDDGWLVYQGDDANASKLAAGARCRLLSFGLSADCDWRAANRRDKRDGQDFDLLVDGRPKERVECVLAGEHNTRNALAAMAAAHVAGLSPEILVPAMKTFRGVRRRLEVLVDHGGIALYDDFAHHPSAVRLTLETLRRTMKEEERLVAVLEPRSNTMVRRRVQQDLVDALEIADVVLIAEVDRPDRFSADLRLDVDRLAADLQKKGCRAAGPCRVEEIEDILQGDARAGDRIVVMSNGGFGGLPQRLAAYFGGER